jgi:hypothetical protein
MKRPRAGDKRAAGDMSFREARNFASSVKPATKETTRGGRQEGAGDMSFREARNFVSFFFFYIKRVKPAAKETTRGG